VRPGSVGLAAATGKWRWKNKCLVVEPMVTGGSGKNRGGKKKNEGEAAVKYV
jgi:hypothetical protein